MIKTLAASIAAILCAGSVSAATIDFNGVNGSVPYATSYFEDGYVLTASSPSSGSHYGDVFGDFDRFGWHAGGDNANSQSWTLARVGGGLFDMLSFQLGGMFGSEDMRVRNSNGGNFNLDDNSNYATTSSTWSTVSWVSFTLNGNEDAWMDNIRTREISAVPGPAALPLAASGMALLGFAGWRRRKS